MAYIQLHRLECLLPDDRVLVNAERISTVTPYDLQGRLKIEEDEKYSAAALEKLAAQEADLKADRWKRVRNLSDTASKYLELPAFPDRKALDDYEDYIEELKSCLKDSKEHEDKQCIEILEGIIKWYDLKELSSELSDTDKGVIQDDENENRSTGRHALIKIDGDEIIVRESFENVKKLLCKENRQKAEQ